MAESNSKSAWLDPRFLLALVVAAASAITSYAIAQERIRQNKETITDLKVRIDAVEKKIPGMDTIDASLKKIDSNLEKLTDRFNQFLEGELTRHR